MKNLNDLNNLLFKQLERLDNDYLTGEDLKTEMEKARTVTQVANMIIQNGNLVLQAAKFKDDMWSADATLPKILDGDSLERK